MIHAERVKKKERDKRETSSLLSVINSRFGGNNINVAQLSLLIINCASDDVTVNNRSVPFITSAEIIQIGFNYGSPLVAVIRLDLHKSFQSDQTQILFAFETEKQKLFRQLR